MPPIPSLTLSPPGGAWLLSFQAFFSDRPARPTACAAFLLPFLALASLRRALASRTPQPHHPAGEQLQVPAGVEGGVAAGPVGTPDRLGGLPDVDVARAELPRPVRLDLRAVGAVPADGPVR